MQRLPSKSTRLPDGSTFTRYRARDIRFPCCMALTYKRHRCRSREYIFLARSCVTAGIRELPRRPLFGDHGKPDELGRPECRGNCDIGGIATPRNDDAADARMIVPRIEGIPAATEIDFKPRTEVHGSRVFGDTYVAEITSTISSGDVETPTKRNRQMRKIPAYAAALRQARA